MMRNGRSMLEIKQGIRFVTLFGDQLIIPIGLAGVYFVQCLYVLDNVNASMQRNQYTIGNVE